MLIMQRSICVVHFVPTVDINKQMGNSKGT